MATKRRKRLRRQPSFMEVHRIYREAKTSMPYRQNGNPEAQQGHLRRVSAEFCKRLERAGIYVEGLS